MGLLDDAIREHLDLKRRRGADPADIERAEREALGPVRREPGFDEAALAPSAPQAEMSAERYEDNWAEDDAAPAALDDPYDVVDEPYAPEPHDPDANETELLETLPPEPVAPADTGEAVEPTPVVEPPAPGVPAEPLIPDPAEAASGPSGIAAPGYAEPDFDRHEVKPRRRGFFHRRSHEPEPEPIDEETGAPPAVRRIDRSEPEPPVAPDLPRAPASDAETSFVDDDELFAPEPDADAPRSLDVGPSHGSTVEYDVEEAFRDDDVRDRRDRESASGPAPTADEDILEETPDFLADTPDHDRLWFEQKPPPDFDFDA
jgi:hypothetical protein